MKKNSIYSFLFKIDMFHLMTAVVIFFLFLFSSPICPIHNYFKSWMKILLDFSLLMELQKNILLVFDTQIHQKNIPKKRPHPLQRLLELKVDQVETLVLKGILPPN